MAGAAGVVHGYVIERSEININYPPGIEPLRAPAASLDNAVVVNPGFGTSTIVAREVGPDEPLMASLRFEAGSLIDAPPVWQAKQMAQDELAWLWLTVGGGIFVIGLLAFVTKLRSYRASVSAPAVSTTGPPMDVPPAIAGTLRTLTPTPTWTQALGALFDLASRHVRTIEALPKKRWGSADFVIRQVGSLSQLRPHEEALLDLLFADKSG